MKTFNQETFEKYCKICRYSLDTYCWLIKDTCDKQHKNCDFQEKIKREKPDDKQETLF